MGDLNLILYRSPSFFYFLGKQKIDFQWNVWSARSLSHILYKMVFFDFCLSPISHLYWSFNLHTRAMASTTIKLMVPSDLYWIQQGLHRYPAQLPHTTHWHNSSALRQAIIHQTHGWFKLLHCVEFRINRNIEERANNYLSGSRSSDRFNPALYGHLDPWW